MRVLREVATDERLAKSLVHVQTMALIAVALMTNAYQPKLSRRYRKELEDDMCRMHFHVDEEACVMRHPEKTSAAMKIATKHRTTSEIRITK